VRDVGEKNEDLKQLLHPLPQLPFGSAKEHFEHSKLTAEIFNTIHNLLNVLVVLLITLCVGLLSFKEVFKVHIK
jgi:hypothetical protein